jgi:uncharacterized repeat protein (TIGR04076 family)
MKLWVEVIDIKGICPIFEIGDKILIDGPQIDTKNTDALCIHALPSLLHFILALREGADPMKLGLSKEEGVAYIQCPDPGKPFTPGGTVIFKITRTEKRSL